MPSSPALEPPPPALQPSPPSASPPTDHDLPEGLLAFPEPDQDASPLYPSPSSSFRPPPELEDSSLLARLDSRLARDHTKPPPDPASPAQPPDPVAPTSSSSSSFLPPPPNLDLPGVSLDPTPVIVRDFAFPRDDPRFAGAPHEVSQHGSGAAAAASNEDDVTPGGSPQLVGNDAFATSGSSAYSWGFVTSHQTDFVSEDDSQLYSEPDEDEDDDDLDDLDPSTGPESALIPGRYTALYDFARVLDTEMDMAAGEVVSVLSRQCNGWVLAVRLKDGLPTEERGLIPENYVSLTEAADFSGGTPPLPLSDSTEDLESKESGVDGDDEADDAADGQAEVCDANYGQSAVVPEDGVDDDEVATPWPVPDDNDDLPPGPVVNPLAV